LRSSIHPKLPGTAPPCLVRRYAPGPVSPFRASAPFTDDWRHFQFEVDNGVATVTFDRPEKLNALTFDVYADFRDLLAELEHRNDVSVLVVTGSGKGFCSGGDVDEIIGELQGMDTKGLLEFTRMTGTVVERMRRLPIPIVASVNGVAAGAGSVIALAADLRLLAASASFHFLFTKVGLAGADMGSAYLLPRVVGLGRATEMLMLGEKVDADQAVAVGLASRVVEDERLPAETSGLARRVAGGPAMAYAATKILVGRELDMDLSSAIEFEAFTQALMMTSEDHAEFYRAFTGKRPPEWTGR
jgi:enoyl-CoA hydratase/carnithine racemase